MYSAKELEQVSDQCGTMGVPEVFYGLNHLYIAKPDRDFLFEISPIDVLSMSSYAKREQYFKQKEAEVADKMAGLSVQEVDSERALNFIDIIPKNIEVQ